MIIKLLLALAFIAILSYGYAYVRRLPDPLRTRVWWWLSIMVIGLLILLVATGRLSWLGALLGSFLLMLRNIFALVMKGLPLLMMLRNKAKGASKFSGQNALIRTTFIELSIEKNTGAVSGQVLTGEFSGRTLASLHSSEQSSFKAYLKNHCTDSYYLYCSYLAYSSVRSGHSSTEQHALHSPTTVMSTSKSEMMKPSCPSGKKI